MQKLIIYSAVIFLLITTASCEPETQVVEMTSSNFSTLKAGSTPTPDRDAKQEELKKTKTAEAALITTNETLTLSSTPKLSFTPSPTPTLLSLTPTASLTPSITPTPDQSVLLPSNINQLSHLAWWGQGVPNLLEWSNKDNIIAVASSLGVYLYDAETLDLKRFISTRERIFDIAINPDGKTLATGSDRVLLWDIETGKGLGTWGTAGCCITDLAYSPRGTWIAAIGVEDTGGDPPYTLTIWNTASGDVFYREESVGGGWGTTIEFSPNGRILALKSMSWLSLFDIESKKWIKHFNTEVSSHRVAFVPGSNQIALGVGQNRVDFIDKETERVEQSFSAQGYYDIFVSPEANTLIVTGDWNDSRGVWETKILDIKSGEERFSLDDIGTVSFQPNGNKFATYSKENMVEIWDAYTGELLNSLPREYIPQSAIFGPYFSDDFSNEQVLYSSTTRGKILIIDPQTTDLIRVIDASEYSITSIAVHPGGQIIALCAEENLESDVFLMDLNSEEIFQTFHLASGEYSRACAMAFSHDGTALAINKSSFLGSIDAWDINTGEKLENPFEKSWRNGNNIGSNRYGHIIRVDYQEESGTYSITDLQTKQLMASFDKDEGWMCQELQIYSISPDNKYLAIGCDKHTIPVWDLTTQYLHANFSGHTPSTGDGFFGNITDIAFSPYSSLLVTSGWDGKILFWDVRKNQLLFSLSEHTGKIIELAFSEDGKYLASVSVDGTLRLWGLQN